MDDLEAGEIVDQPGPTPPRLNQAGVLANTDTTHYSNGARAGRENVTGPFP